MIFEFNKRSQQFHLWINEADEILTDPLNAYSPDALQQLQARFELFLSEFNAMNTEQEALSTLAQKIDKEGERSFHNTYPSLLVAWENIKKLVEERRQAFSERAMQIQNQEQISQDISEKINVLAEFVQEQTAAIANVSGTPEEQIQKIHDVQHLISTKRDSFFEIIAKASGIQASIEDGTLVNFSLSGVTFEELKTQWNALTVVALQKEVTLLKEQNKVEETGGALKPEQLREFKECFNYFDSNQDGYLDKKEFSACLQSLSYLPKEESIMNHIMEELDTLGKGISFAAFLQYLENLNSYSDNPSKIKDAFALIASGKDFITEAQIKSAGFSQQKQDYLLNHIPKTPDGAGYDYKQFVEKIYS